MEKLAKLIPAKNGFTLIEMTIVITMLAVISIAAFPAFNRSMRRSQFQKKVADVVLLIDEARTQALASKLDSSEKIPSGGYGVFLDMTSDIAPTLQKAVLFIDDWNATVAVPAAVNVNYGDEDIANRVLPDGIYTAGGDSVITTVDINSPVYIQMTQLKGVKLADASNWASAVGNNITVIFKPPFAETVIWGNATISLQNIEVVFDLITDGSTRRIKFNRVTTAPQVFKN